MNRIIMLLASVVMVVLSSVGAPPVRAVLPACEFSDLETTTNVSFRAALDAAGRFVFSLSCR